MNTTDLLEQLLRGQASAGQSRGAAGSDGLGGLLGGLLGGGGSTSTGGGAAGGGLGGLGGLLGGLLGGGGGGLGGALGGALGGGAQRRSGGTNYAALASLGMMAYQAYQAWQRSQVNAPQAMPQTADLLAGPEMEEHSHAVLRALIAAAKADGRIDEAEKHRISSEIGKHTADPQLQEWLDAEVAKPLDPTEVAQSAHNDPAVAAEMYLASVMLVDDQQAAERNYLNELAAALGIDPQLQAHLEHQARA